MLFVLPYVHVMNSISTSTLIVNYYYFCTHVTSFFMATAQPSLLWDPLNSPDWKDEKYTPEALARIKRFDRFESPFLNNVFN